MNKIRDRLFAISQTGVSHLSSDMEQSFSPCQDAYKILDFPGSDVPEWDGSLCGTIIAVADGHGHPVYHGSSEFGSKLAVESAVDCLLELVSAYEKDEEVNHFEKFPKRVVEEWRTRVLTHAEGRFPEKDLRECFDIEFDYEEYLERIYTDYGSTLLAAVVIPDKQLLVTAQLGDGDILLLHRGTDKVRRLACEGWRREFGSNRTDSLCMYHADKKFQMEILDGRESEEDAALLNDYLLMVATDGISSGALSEKHYIRDYCKKWMNLYMQAECHEDRKFVQQLMEREMRKKLRLLSTDDMTVVFLHINNCDAK